MKLPKYYSLFEPAYSEEIAGEQIFLLKYEKIPSTSVDRTLYTDKILKYFEEKGFKPFSKLSSLGGRNGTLRGSDEVLWVCDNKELLLKTKKDKSSKEMKVMLYYSLENGELKDQIDISFLDRHKIRRKKSTISLIRAQGGGYLDLEDYEVKIPKTDLSLNYGEEFKKIHETIINKLNKKEEKGIVLLHGEPGTGKTTYIKYLSTQVKTKNVIFVPPSMAEMLTDPSIIPFLMDYRNSILIIEDAEKVLGSRESGSTSSQSTSNLLNLTDGILGDCLNIQIVATFNTKRDNIDEAFMRKGRLIAEHKFEKLSDEETNNLLQHIGKDVEVKEGMVLSDIYNIDVDVYKTIKKGKIGF